MKIKCPACACEGDIALFLGADDASQAIATALQYCEIGTELMRYIALFKPLKTGKISPQRVNTLLAELLPDFKSQRIQRDGIIVDAPPEAWRYAINQMINNADLQKPLKSHGYLYEIIKGYRRSDAAKVLFAVEKQLVEIDQDDARRLRMEMMK